MTSTVQLPVEGRLPSLAGGTGWLNTEPLTPESLRGRPVVVEFWTFTCINWLRTLPYVRSWWERYQGDGLVVLGVHTPEFEVEQDLENVRRATEEMAISFPVAVDSDYRIWAAFGNRYWPALYFGDDEGQIRHHHFGEGDYEYSESVIQQLLGTGGELSSVEGTGAEAPPDWENLQSPESYVGYERADAFASPGGVARDQPREYLAPDALGLNSWALNGEWTVGRQAAELNVAGGGITHRFHARDLHLVLGPGADDQPVRFRVRIDGHPPEASHGTDTNIDGEGTVTEPRLYQLVRQHGPVAEHTFEITFLDADVRAYVFTFG